MIELGRLHSEILNHIIAHGFAPDPEAIARTFRCSVAESEESLLNLQDYHGVVLHPNQNKVWVIHPFSLAPTLFTVKSARGLWWGNCAWCSFGAAVLLNEDVSITTNLGGHDQQVTINIRNGRLDRQDLYVHFPVPMVKAWDNVIYTCSTMLLFKSERDVTEWSTRHNIPRGDLQPIERIWEFSKVWYGNHLKPDWTKWTGAEAKAIFQRFDLTNNTWELEASGRRF